MRLVNWSTFKAGFMVCGAKDGIIFVAITLVVRPNFLSSNMDLYSSAMSIVIDGCFKKIIRVVQNFHISFQVLQSYIRAGAWFMNS